MVARHIFALTGAAAALTLAGGVAAQTGTGGAQSLADIAREATELRGRFNAELDRWEPLKDRAKDVRAELPGARDKKLDVPRVPRKRSTLEVSELLAYLPRGMARRIDERIYMEYVRGYYDWQAGQNPPFEYASFDSNTFAWTRSIFDQWDRDVYLSWSVPRSIWRLYLPRNQSTTGTAEGFETALERAAELRGHADESIAAAAAYEPEAKSTRWSWLPFVGPEWSNEGEWDEVSSTANKAMEGYRRELDRADDNLDGVVSRWVAEALDYEDGDTPFLRYRPRFVPGSTGTGDGYDRIYAPSGFESFGWHYYFDLQVLDALPRELRHEVLRRYVHAYFRGAHNAKYSQDLQRSSGTGSGYDYGWYSDYRRGSGTGAGTGDGRGYGYGDDRRYGGTGTGGTGDGRRGNAWGTGGTGEGTGGGLPGTGGTGGTGSTDFNPGGTGSGDGIFGTGGGSGSTGGTGGFPGGGGTGGSGGTSGGGLGTGGGSTGGTGGTGSGGGSGGTGTGTGF